MVAERSRPATGYPPVTAAEEHTAAENVATGPSGREAGGIGPDGKVIVDAIAAVIDDHRRRIDAAAIDPEAKRYVLDLLDAVFLDLLQSVLNESGPLELVQKRRRATS
jgi:hypothetical protein